MWSIIFIYSLSEWIVSLEKKIIAIIKKVYIQLIYFIQIIKKSVIFDTSDDSNVKLNVFIDFSQYYILPGNLTWFAHLLRPKKNRLKQYMLHKSINFGKSSARWPDPVKLSSWTWT